MKKKILTVLGARPQFIKCAPVSLEIRKYFDEFILHTGQHYDYSMSKLFFDELRIPSPDLNLAVGSGTHANQTARMMISIEKVLNNKKPDLVIVYGDTNSTLAGSLAAVKLKIPVAHIEAGLRSFNNKMPEEINRIISDKISAYLFCPTSLSIENLKMEGIVEGAFLTGDVMYDSLKLNFPIADKKSNILNNLNLVDQKYYLATVHRAENTDNPNRLSNILRAFGKLNLPVIIPLHPRTQKIFKENSLKNIFGKNIRIINPLGYLDIIKLLKNALKLFTDSGGMQKEAFFLQVPCITLRDETEWIETLDMGVNILVGSDEDKIIYAANSFNPNFNYSNVYGDGNSSKKIAKILKNILI